MKLKLLFISLFICTAGISQDFIMKKKLADKYFDNFDFYKAAPMYEQLVKGSPEDRHLYEKLAAIYDHLNNSVKSEQYYSFLVQCKDPRPSDLVNYARSLARNGKYDDAITWYRNYHAVQPGDPRGALFADAYRNIHEFYRDSSAFTIVKAPFNTPADEFSPAYFGKHLVFASDRSKSSMVRTTYNWTNSSFLDLFMAEPESHQYQPFSKEINSNYHEGPVSFNKSRDTLFFTRSNFVNARLSRSQEGVNRLSIVMANRDARSEKWINLRKLQLCSDEYSAEHPALSPAGDKLYFASDMPGGLGGMDLYVSFRSTESNGKISWGVPVNLGPGINSPGNEVFPFADNRGNLWYASDGIPGLGGLDIFFAAKAPEGFSRSVNPGYPMNTRFDDFGFITLNGGQDGYFSSNRYNDFRDDDIFKISRTFRQIAIRVTDAGTRREIPNVGMKTEEEKDETAVTRNDSGELFHLVVDPYTASHVTFFSEKYLPVTILLPRDQPKGSDTLNVSLTAAQPALQFKGSVLSAGNSPVANAKVSLTNKSASWKAEFVTDANGSFNGELEPGDDYRFRLTSNLGENCHAPALDVSTSGLSRDSILHISMPVYCQGDVIRLDNIHYALNDSKILPDAAKVLDKLATLMNEYPGMKIELRSHTDSRGSLESNRVLSEKRAQKAMEYLLSKGIQKNRLSGKGYGETMPVNRCGKDVPCSEEEHRQNRRTEFKILKWQ